MQQLDILPTLQNIYRRTQQHRPARSISDDQALRVCGRVAPSDFHAYPPSNSRSNDLAVAFFGFERVFAVQMKNTAIRKALESAIWPLNEVLLDFDDRIQVKEHLSQIRHDGNGQSAALIRSDASLIVWAESPEALIALSQSLQARLERSFLPVSPPTYDSGSYLSIFDGADGRELDELLREDVILQKPEPSLGALSSLHDFSYLPTLPPTLSPASEDVLTSAVSPASSHDDIWNININEFDTSPMAGLQRSFRDLRTSCSPWSEASTLTGSSTTSNLPASSLPMTVCPADVSPPSYYVAPSEDTDTPAHELQPFSFKVERSQSVGFDSDSDDEHDPQPSRVVGHKSKRTFRDIDGDEADDEYVPRPRAPAGLRKRKCLSHFPVPTPELSPVPIPPSPSVTPSPSVDDDLTLRSPSLPPSLDVDADLTPAPSPAPIVAGEVTAGPSAPPAEKKKKRRTARRSSNKAKNGPRSKCAYCPKSFGRSKDRDRHQDYSCELNVNKKDVLCEQCGEPLSRPDSAKRHLQVHLKKGLPPPEIF